MEVGQSQIKICSVVTGLMYNNSDNTFFLLYIFRPITNFCLIKRDWFSKSVLSYLC